ncbi:MAG: sensor histidine kinase [Planctomycetota bacterium]
MASPHFTRQLLVVGTVGVVGLGAVIAIYRSLRQREDRLVRSQFQMDAEERIAAIEHEFEMSVLTLTHATAALFDASEEVTREEFGRFTGRLLAESEHIRAMEWVVRVEDGDRFAHESSMHEEGFDDYRINEVGSEGRRSRASKRSVYFPVRFVEPFDRFRETVGNDLGADPLLRTAILEADRTGRPTAASSTDRGDVVRVFAPVADKTGTTTDDGSDSRGFVSVVFQIGDLIQTLGYAPVGIDLFVFDQSDAAQRRLLYARPSPRRIAPFEGSPPPPPGPGDIGIVSNISIGARPWQLVCTPTDSYLAEHQSSEPLRILVVGAGLIFVLTAYLYLLSERAGRVQQLVAERTNKLEDRAAELARVNERLVRQTAILEATTDFVGYADPQGHAVYVNQAGRRMVGLTDEDDVTAMRIPDFHPQWAADLLDKEALPTAIRDGSWSGELALRTRDGRDIPVSAVILSHRDESGEVTFLAAVLRDISQRKQAEAERDQFFNVSLELLCIADVTGYFKRLNPAWTRTLGWTAEELCAQPFIEFVHPDDRASTLAELDRLRGGEDTVYFENRYRCRDGSYRWLGWTCPAPDPGQTLLFAAAHDITPLKEAHDQLQLAKEAAESASRAKTQFLANMSHELRTPLNAIMGYAYLLAQEAADRGHESYRSDLGRIHDAGEHLLALINEVLDLSKIEAGRMELHLEDFDIASVVREAISMVQPLVERNGNTIDARVDDDIGHMHADVTKTRQILFNLLSNASKFTENGRIRMEASRHAGDDGEADLILFVVADTGIGMSRDQLEHVFDEFSQADISTTRRYGGTGLGLTITRKFCRMMGGGIEVESEPDVGSTFKVRLPAVVPNAAPNGKNDDSINELEHGGDVAGRTWDTEER